MKLFGKSIGKRGPKISRQAAMGSRPAKLPIVRREERDNGAARITVLLQRPGWTRLLGGGGQYERTFGLDAFGCEVYDACDGHKRVEAIVRQFAAGHKISLAEAEVSVTTFLRTLMAKGLVAMKAQPEKP